jgi:NOL1/NOP2/sun family putative RNA methylase
MDRKALRKTAKSLAKEYSYLPYMIERYLILWGETETLRFLEACELPVRTAIRINTLKSSVNQTWSRLEEKGVTLEKISWLEEGCYADFGEMSPGSTFEHMLGFYYIQGVPSIATVKALDPQPGETVFDLAAAPGGKTTHISQLMQNSGLIIAIEEDRSRIRSLESNIMRCGVTNTIILRGDAKKIGELKIEPNRILLDAPCTGEGLIALDPTRKTSKTSADIHYCSTQQGKLLDAAVNKLAPGGVVIYSTCSIAPEENEYIVDNILRRYSNLEVETIPVEFGSPAFTQPFGVQLDHSLLKARRFLPHIHGTEGFFICKMVKHGER